MADYTLNATAASLLGFLHDRPMAGWDLVANAQMRIGEFWSLTQSQVYRELAAMSAAGLIEAGERGPRDRRPYTLTEAGRQAFAAWAAIEPGEATIRIPLLLTIALGRHIPPAHLHAAVQAHRARHAAQLAKYEAQHAGSDAWCDLDPYALATLDFGIAYERAILAWFDGLAPAISGVSTAGDNGE
jgi:DNA-binding PadR family transcriptional regulator